MKACGICVGLCLVLTACSSSDEVGFGTPVQPASDAYEGPRVDLTGTVVVQGNGCIDLDLGVEGVRWIVWPSTVGQDQGRPVLDGRRVLDGDVLTATGALVDADVLSGWSQDDSYFGSFGRFCSADERGVVILDAATVGP